MGRFKVGLAAGFCAGYILGAKAGHERYDQIAAAWKKIERSSSFQTAFEKVRAAVGLSLERGKVVALEGLEKASELVRTRNTADRATFGQG